MPAGQHRHVGQDCLAAVAEAGRLDRHAMRILTRVHTLQFDDIARCIGGDDEIALDAGSAPVDRHGDDMSPPHSRDARQTGTDAGHAGGVGSEAGASEDQKLQGPVAGSSRDGDEVVGLERSVHNHCDRVVSQPFAILRGGDEVAFKSARGRTADPLRFGIQVETFRGGHRAGGADPGERHAFQVDDLHGAGALRRISDVRGQAKPDDTIGSHSTLRRESAHAQQLEIVECLWRRTVLRQGCERHEGKFYQRAGIRPVVARMGHVLQRSAW